MNTDSTIDTAVPRPRAFRAVLILLAALFVPWSIVAYNHTGEDLFITLRYAKHFIEGHGLIFNPEVPAEHVEGYSNLLWLLIVSLFGWLGANMDITARFLAILAGCALIVAMPLYRRASGDRVARRWIELFGPLAILSQPILHGARDDVPCPSVVFGRHPAGPAMLLGCFASARRRSHHAPGGVCVLVLFRTRGGI